MCIGLRSGSNDVLPSIKGRKTLNRWNPQETGAHWRATGARVTVRRVNSGGTQAAFATYLQDEAHTLWEVDENDAYGLALDTLSLTVESLPDDDPDLIYLQQFVEGGVFVPPDELFSRLLHRITLRGESQPWLTDRQFVDYLVRHHRKAA